MLKYFILLLSVAFVSTAAVAEYDDDDFELRKFPQECLEIHFFGCFSKQLYSSYKK